MITAIENGKEYNIQIPFEPVEDEIDVPFYTCDGLPVLPEPKFAAYFQRGQSAYSWFKREEEMKKIVQDTAGDENDNPDLTLVMPDRFSGLSQYELEGNTVLQCQILKRTDGLCGALLTEDGPAAITSLFTEEIYFYFKSEEEKLFPLLEYCAEKRIPCSLLGHMSHDNTIFEIQDIIMGFLTDGRLKGNKPYAEDDLLQPVKRKVIKKLLGKEVSLYDRTYDSQAECSMIIEFFPEFYPDDVSRIVLKALRDQGKSYITSSAKKQALSNALGLINVDWRIHTVDYPAISEIRKDLDKTFYGMESVKNRILEIMARLKKCNEVPKWGILLQGPPGVGKTSMLRFLAKLLQRPEIYLDTSSVIDNNGIVGSSRIYDNGQPGVILREIIEHRTAQQTFVINEIDKMNPQGQGTLLSLLDRKGYTDANFDLPIALTGLIFIATCNDLEQLSAPLKDRFEIIRLQPYTIEEKQIIFTDYVFPSLLQRAGLSPSDLCVAPEAVEMLCKYYVTDFGARDLEKYGERIIDNYLLCAETGSSVPQYYGKDKIAEFIGPPKCPDIEICATPGMARAVIVRDGIVLNNLVEARVVPGHGEIKITGLVSQPVKDYITVACQYAFSLGLFSADKHDILLRLQNPIPESYQNTIGLSALCAILSDVSGTVFDSNFIAMGGVTLHGGLYYDGNDVDAILSCCEEKEITKVFCPVGCTKKIHKKHKGISLVEVYDVASFLGITNMLP